MPRSPCLPVVALLALGCPRTPANGPTGEDAVTVVHRAPIQCRSVTRSTTDEGADASEPRGCNATVRFDLAPSGRREVDVPFWRDAARATSSARAEGTVVDRTVVLRDPAGERLWSADVPEDRFPWAESGQCAPTPDKRSFDFNPWQFLVVRVQTRDALGTTRPLAEAQEDTLRLMVHPQGGEPIRPTIVPSTTHDGVWAAVWCAADPGLYELELDVRGAYQADTDRFTMPDPSGDTYSFLDYVLVPIEGAEGL